MMQSASIFNKRLAAVIANVIAAGLLMAAPAYSANLSFALFGDVYMTPEHQGYLKGMLADMADKNEALAIFTGGLKPTDQGCQDKHLLAAFPIFAQAPLPTFYVPGDAEWALCTKFTPEDRLALLRKTYYQSNTSLGEPSLPLSRQPDYPELMRWELDSGKAIFATLNVTGNNNRWGNKTYASSEYLDRNATSLTWLQDTFRIAADKAISMLVIVMHGDPEFNTPGETEAPKGYRPLIDQLRIATEQFKGQVLLVHGGSGIHRIDHPLINPANDLPYQNFTRVETYGALQQGWVEVSIAKNKLGGDDPITRTEFRFESFPWPPLSDDIDPNMGQEIDTMDGRVDTNPAGSNKQ